LTRHKTILAIAKQLAFILLQYMTLWTLTHKIKFWILIAVTWCYDSSASNYLVYRM